jgi:hypothetical protein
MRQSAPNNCEFWIDESDPRSGTSERTSLQQMTIAALPEHFLHNVEDGPSDDKSSSPWLSRTQGTTECRTTITRENPPQIADESPINIIREAGLHRNAE